MNQSLFRNVFPSIHENETDDVLITQYLLSRIESRLDLLFQLLPYPGDSEEYIRFYFLKEFKIFNKITSM